MRVAGQGDVFSGGAELHADTDLVNQVARRGADDVAAEDAVGFLVDQHLHKALALEHGLRAAVAHEGELADLVGLARLFQLRLRRADHGDLRCGVDHRGDHAVVHVAMLACDHFGAGHALVLGLVGEHRALDHVTDGVDAVHRRLPVVVDGDLAALRHLDPQRVQPQPFGKRLAAGRDQHHVGIDGMFAVVLAQLVGDLGLRLRGLHLRHRCAHGELKPLLREDLLELLLDLGIHARGDVVKEFDDLHLCTQTLVDGAHLEPDHARADDDHLLRHLRQGQRAGRIHDHTAVVVHGHVRTRNAGHFGARRDDDVLGVIGLVADLDLALFGDGGPALQPVDLVLLEQELDALGVLADDVVLVGQHLFPVDRRRFALQAHLGKVVLCLVQLVRGVQQGLRRDAAHVQAGAAQRLAAFHAGGLEAKLRAADRGNVAAGTGADDDDVVLGHVVFLLSEGEEAMPPLRRSPPGVVQPETGPGVRGRSVTGGTRSA